MLYDRPQESAGDDAMDGPEIGLDGFSPRTQWSRRGFVMTSLVTGFALSVRPVSAQTITTDTNGLDAPALVSCACGTVGREQIGAGRPREAIASRRGRPS